MTATAQNKAAPWREGGGGMEAGGNSLHRPKDTTEPATAQILEAVLLKLDRGPQPDPDKWPDSRGEYWALCPFHADHRATNFSVSERGYHCFACGAQGSLADLAQRLGIAVARLHATGGGIYPPSPPLSLTLENYASGKCLPLEFLQSLGLETVHLQGKPVLKIPYYDQDGVEVAARLRLALTGENRFRWRKGSKPQPYGLWRLPGARERGFAILVEGESDAQTLWLYDLPAVGVPGASAWRPEWAEYLQGLEVFVWQEPDRGGKEFARWVGASIPRARIMAAPDGRKDVSECHVLGDDIPALIQRLMSAARPWAELAAEEASQEAQEARALAADLLACPDILAAFGHLARALGLVGEERNAKLLYLALTSRLLDRPVNVIVKGPSAGGKSYLVETVLRAFPPSAAYVLTAFSEHSLAYDQEPIAHRFLILFEAAGLSSEFAQYLMRSLLSEGRVRYLTVIKGEDGLEPRLIEREGPTGLVCTTTWASLHPENETRVLSVTVRDDALQTKAVLKRLAAAADGQEPSEPDLTAWHALQRWLELAGAREVTIPYAPALAEATAPAAVRIRRDFGAVLALVKAHAVLHQCQRERDARGRIVATLADYEAVYRLIADVVDEAAQATVSPLVSETVRAVAELLQQNTEGAVQVLQVAKRLRLDKSAALRRVRVACDLGYLVNLEDRRGKPARLVLGEPLPEERPVLPPPETLAGGGEGGNIPSRGRATVQPLPATCVICRQPVSQYTPTGVPLCETHWSEEENDDT